MPKDIKFDIAVSPRHARYACTSCTCTNPDSLVTFVTITKSLLVYRYETVVSKEPVGKGKFRVTKYNRANYIALNLAYATGFISYVHERDHILSHSLFTIHKMGKLCSCIYGICSRAYS